MELKAVAASIVFLALLLPAGEAAAQSGASRALAELFEQEWEDRLKNDPLFATRVGDHRYDDRLPSVSPGDFDDRLKAARDYLRRVQSIDREELTESERIDARLFEQLMQDRVAEYTFRSYLIPITNREGFHVDFAQLPEWMPFGGIEDYENYIARLEAFEEYVEDNIALMKQGIEEDMTLPKVVLEGYEATLEPHIVDDPSQSLLFAPFEDIPDAIPQNERERLTLQGRRAISESVVPGYAAFLSFMRDEYYPAAREEIAARMLPNGQAFYEYRVRHFTSLDLTPPEVHSVGLVEVRRIRQEMERVLRDVGYESDFEGFIEFLREDERFYATDPEELLSRTSLVLKRMDGRLPELFRTLPRLPYGIREVPDYIAPKTTTAYYTPGAGDGSRAGYYNVNTYDLASRPLYEIEALSFHEAVPGHHLQIALQQEIETLPPFRRFAGFDAFVEGWALYAERLGKEVGFYTDPYSEFGRLSYEMWRACRLVVDPGIHYMGWTRQEAIDFMAQNTALSLYNIEAEVDRYIAWPGQAVAYKMGELKIRDLRRRAESELGERFDLREFHDVVLMDGSVPLDVLEQKVDAYIARVKSKG